ncbi:AEC family transporter [Allorhizobium sp. BGMRC 0089]|uniref:AEC family transporter n=1 Tax=Allorhizobium sonneratiae TaxID=2934936 RepID=UPI002033CC3B|nr:AEC family transporter [Allorhizobium sonneratiae]MCM2291729.1 AEC family transporter [Allorhizobium sonneratiae]
MLAIVFDVLPIFLLILTGWAVVKIGFVKSELGPQLGDFVFKVAVPVLMFHTITTANFGTASPLRLWSAYFFGILITWTIGHLLATRLFGRDRRIGVLAGVSSSFANNVFIGLPLISRVLGNDGLVAVSILLVVHLPLMMVIGTVMMENAERRETGGHARGLGAVLLQVGRNLLTNPLVIGLLLGLVVHESGVPVPSPIESVLSQISGMAGPLALMSLGMALTRYHVSGNAGIAMLTSGLKLFCLPACVWVGCHIVGLTGTWAQAMVLTASVPTGINAWLIANRFGIGHELAASTITLTTAFGVLSVTFWAFLLGLGG